MGNYSGGGSGQQDSAACLFEGIAAGGQLAGRLVREAARGKRLPGRAAAVGGRDEDLLCDLAAQIGHSGILWQPRGWRAHVLRGAAPARGLVRCGVPAGPADWRG